MKKYLTFLSILLISCVTVPVTTDNTFSITLKNNTGKICYYSIEWFDHDFKGFPANEPVNVAGGLLRAGKTYSLLNRRTPGQYSITWTDDGYKTVEESVFTASAGDEIVLEYNGYAENTGIPTYEEFMHWYPLGVIAQGPLKQYDGDPYNFKDVNVVMVENSDPKGEWIGAFAFLDSTTVELLRVIFMHKDKETVHLYSVIDEKFVLVTVLDLDDLDEPVDKSHGI